MKWISGVKSEKGSMIVEAAMAIPVFIFAIVTILSVIKICSAQVLMTNTVNGIAEDFSKLSYVMCKVGIIDAKKSIADKSKNIEGAVSDIINSQNFQELIDNLKNGLDVAKSEEKLGESLLYVVLNSGTDVLSDIVGGQIIKALAESRMRFGTYTAEDLMSHYGIENITYHMTINTDTGVIYIIADYSIKVVDYLAWIDHTFEFSKLSKTMIWNPATSYADKGKDESDSTERSSNNEDIDTTEENDASVTTEENVSTTEEEIYVTSQEPTTEDPDTIKYNALVEQYGKKDIDEILRLYGMDALDVIYLYGDAAYLAIYYYGGDAYRYIKEYGQAAAHAICSNGEHLIEIYKLFDEYGEAAVDAVSEYGYESDEQIIAIIKGD